MSDANAPVWVADDDEDLEHLAAAELTEFQPAEALRAAIEDRR